MQSYAKRQPPTANRQSDSMNVWCSWTQLVQNSYGSYSEKMTRFPSLEWSICLHLQKGALVLGRRKSGWRGVWGPTVHSEEKKKRNLSSYISNVALDFQIGRTSANVFHRKCQDFQMQSYCGYRLWGKSAHTQRTPYIQNCGFDHRKRNAIHSHTLSVLADSICNWFFFYSPNRIETTIFIPTQIVSFDFWNGRKPALT